MVDCTGGLFWGEKVWCISDNLILAGLCLVILMDREESIVLVSDSSPTLLLFFGLLSYCLNVEGRKYRKS